MAWENNWNSVLAKQGMQHMDGVKALLYVRSRHGSARGDFDRTERQRLFLTALSQKVLGATTYTNPVKVSQLLDAFGDHVSTDMSITDALRLAKIMKAAGAPQSIGLSDPPNNYLTTDTVSGLSVVLPTAGIGDYSAIQTYIRTTLKDGYIANENASITVLNGSGVAGAATQEATILKNYGYNVTAISDAPTQNYQTSTIIKTGKLSKPYTQNYLEKRLSVKTVTKLPDPNIQPGTADFVIIVGQDETSNN